MGTNKFDTRCIHGPKNTYDTTGAVSTPIYQTATFAHQGLGKSSGFDYSRLSNPTRDQLEKTVAGLEGGLGAIAFATGMGAIASLMEVFEAGDHIIASEDIYGGSHRLFHQVVMKRGVAFDFVDTGDVAKVAALIRQETKAIYIETPTNPMMQVTDIKEMSTLAKAHDLLLFVDNTFMTPYFQQPIQLGADVVIHSGTKYLGGHNDTLAGVLVINDPDLLDQVGIKAKTLGACLSPFDSWLILRGIKTLPIRMERQQKTAMKVADWLSQQAFVKRLYYVGCDQNPGIEITKKQCTGYGGMISFEVDTYDRVKLILDQVKLIQFAESLGGVESLITYPRTQTHADVPEEERNAKGINDRLLRLSIGLEDPEDIIDDLGQAAKEVH